MEFVAELADAAFQLDVSGLVDLLSQAALDLRLELVPFLAKALRLGGLGVTALLCIFDPLKRNAEVKIVWNCDDHEIAAIDEFYRPQPQAVLVVRRAGM